MRLVCFSLSKGLTAAFLPIYHYVFLNYSRPLAELISNINIDMYGKSDLKFLESMYKVKIINTIYYCIVGYILYRLLPFILLSTVPLIILYHWDLLFVD